MEPEAASNSLAGERSAVRVQNLAQSEPSQVPPQYIQPPPHRPSTNKISIDADFPVIDLRGFDPRHRNAVRDAVGRASSEWGAFQVTNHGVPSSLLNQMRSMALSFFRDCPVSEKLAYACDTNSFASEGYGTQMLAANEDESQSLVLDWRDYFDHHTLPLSRRNPSNWPHFPPNYRKVMAQYSDCMKVLAQKLLAVLSESLGLPSSWIEDAITGRGEGSIYQNITVSYYPSCPQPDLTLGLQPHSDIGAITLLIQDDVGGLQVLDRHGDWVTVQPLSPDAIVVILADQTEILTNGNYKSAEHRVITNSSRARLSVSAFHDPPKSVKLSPAAELVSESSPIRYHDVVYGEYTSSWYSKGPVGKRNIDSIKLHN